VNTNKIEDESEPEQLNQTSNTNNETKVEDNDNDEATPNTVNTVCLGFNNLSFFDSDTIDSMPSLKPRYEYEDSESDDGIDDINMISNYDRDSCISMPSLKPKYDDESSNNDDSYDSENETDDDVATDNKDSTSGNVNIFEEKCTYANVVKKLASDEDDTTSKWIKVSKNNLLFPQSM
jgi:hypothetical protein